MSEVFVAGIGAVTPAGWGLGGFREALASGAEIPGVPVAGVSAKGRCLAARVPPPSERPKFLAHPRLRRASPISQFAVAAALEAIGSHATADSANIGVVLCVMSGSVNYSRRFYAETLTDPATASPLVFPETVFNAPSSHISAVLNSTAPNYTLVGDAGMVLVGLALAAQWLNDGLAESVALVAAEEMDILTASAVGLFERQSIVSEGAGALYLRKDKAGALARLGAITEPEPFTAKSQRETALARVRDSIVDGSSDHLLVESRYNRSQWNELEERVWRDWAGPRLRVKNVFGESLSASAAWQCVAAVDALHRTTELKSATVSVLGLNQQAIAARFEHSHD